VATISTLTPSEGSIAMFCYLVNIKCNSQYKYKENEWIVYKCTSPFQELSLQCTLDNFIEFI